MPRKYRPRLLESTDWRRNRRTDRGARPTKDLKRIGERAPAPPVSESACAEGGSASRWTVQSRCRSWRLPLILGLTSLIGAVALSMRPTATGPVALIFPPWWGGTRAVLAAARSGAVIRFGARPFIVIVLPDGRAPKNALGQSGAWLVLDPAQVGGCSDQSSLE